MGWGHGLVTIFTLVLICRLEDLKGALKYLVHTYDACIFKLATVVGSREECHQLLLNKELIAIFYHLMCLADEAQVMLVQEFGHHLSP